jgi:phenylacetate-coenzyme A ligase PaaK-like adenylate-forming protein
MENEHGEMVPSPKAAYLTVTQKDKRGVGEVVVYTLTNDYMPLLNYQIGDLVERRTSDGKVTYVLHGRSADTVATVDGRRVTVRDIDQCFVGVEGIAHYRLHETSPRHFTLSYIADANKPLAGSPKQALARLTELLKPIESVEGREVKYLLPEGSGKFVLSYPSLKN